MTEALRPVHDFHNPEHYDLGKGFPNPNDWIALGGPRPRVFSPSAIDTQNTLWHVVHIDDSQDDDKRFRNGSVVFVPSGEIRFLRADIPVYKSTSHLDPEAVAPAGSAKSVVVPSLMLRGLANGKDAEPVRSTGSSNYPVINNETEYLDYLKMLQGKQYDERVYRVSHAGTAYRYFFMRRELSIPTFEE
ncbi:hypothetical protein BH23PAT1_BH23PAT1_3160 [soil metagenome]